MRSRSPRCSAAAYRPTALAVTISSLLFIAVQVMAPGAWAAPMTSARAFGFGTEGQGFNSGAFPCTLTDFDEASTPTSASVNDVCAIDLTPPIPVAAGLFFSTVSSGYGMSSAFVQAEGFIAINGATGEAAWQDEWTVFGGTGSGTATIGVTIQGDVSARDDGSGVVSYDIVLGEEGMPGSAEVLSFSRVYSESSSGPIDLEVLGVFDFVYGEPFKISGLFLADASVPLNPFPPTGDFSGKATADFGSSAFVSTLDLPAGSTLVTESGAIYPIPEPGTGLLLASALVALSARRARR